MCQSAGFHRAQSMVQDTEAVRHHKLWVFWTFYGIEKGLSLRIGRASTVRDRDLATPLPEMASVVNPSPYAAHAVRWIRLSSIQGKIYDNLYSPASLSEPDYVRQNWVDALVNETKQLCVEAQVEQKQVRLYPQGNIGTLAYD